MLSTHAHTGAAGDGSQTILGSLKGTAWRTWYTDATGLLVPLALGAAGTVLQSNGASAAPSWSGSVIPIVVRKTSDESVTSSTTLQADDALLFAVAANEKRIFEFFLITDQAGASVPDIKLDFSIPASAAIHWGAVGVKSPGGGVGEWQDWDGTNPLTFQPGAASVSAVRYIHIKGIVINSTNAGNVTLRWAQVASQSDAVRVRAGSYCVHQAA